MSNESLEVRVARLEERVDQIVGDISTLAEKMDGMASKADLVNLQDYFKEVDEERRRDLAELRNYFQEVDQERKKDLANLRAYLEQRDLEREAKFREVDSRYNDMLFWIVKALLLLVAVVVLVSLGVPHLIELFLGL